MYYRYIRRAGDRLARLASFWRHCIAQDFYARQVALVKNGDLLSPGLPLVVSTHLPFVNARI